jgi:hypothetical protein
VDWDPFVCLMSRKPEGLVFFCPMCGLATRELRDPGDTDAMVLRLDELAPAGVVAATRGDLEAAGITEIVEVDDRTASWVAEVLWQPSGQHETDGEATKLFFDRWYRGDRR